MQRLFSLGLLAAVLGGGYALFNGSLPANVEQAASVAGKVLQNPQLGGPVSQPPQGYNQPPQGYNPPPQAYQQAAPGYAPAPTAPGSTIRIATFNILIFGDTKARNTNVMRTLAAIVQNFDIVAVQEIRTQDDYFIDNFLRDYVNAQGRRYSRIVGPRLGRTRSTEQYAFLFDTATIQVNPNYIYTLSDEDDLLHREPLIAMFATRASPAFTFILINTHTDPDEAGAEMDALAQAVDAVRRHGPGEDDVILLGDLNTNVEMSPPSESGFGFAQAGRQLRPSDLHGLGKISGIYPVVRAEPTNTRRSRLHDNILVHRGATTEFTGRAGVFDIERHYGLSREQALMVSDHLPVWAEFTVVEGGAPGRLASGAPAIGR